MNEMSLRDVDVWTPERLIAFEHEIAELFNAGQIRAPVHLSGGNENQLIEIFKDINKVDDWVCGSWRMHYQCLLKGVPPARLRSDIIAGRSITLTYPDYKIISSAIVGGIPPIALGIAWSLKRVGGKGKVWCFLGDMTAMTGIFHECLQYAEGFELPINFIVENNKKSVCTETDRTWSRCFVLEPPEGPLVEYYEYDLPWPHAGAGKRVQF